MCYRNFANGEELNVFTDGEADALRKELATRDRQIEKLNEGIAFLQNQVTRLNQVLAQREEGIKFLRLEVARLSPEPAKQGEWWDDQFSRSWEINSGPAQSTHFMEKLVENLGKTECEFLRSRRLRLLDWGCATGDGLHVLNRAFPGCDAVGMDISKVAVEKAGRKYPDLSFISAPDGELQGEFDVIVTSNCLEHFALPMDWLRRLLQTSRWLVVVLVPFREDPLMEGHKMSFCEDSFPMSFYGFTRVYAKAIKVEPAFWAGGQLLVVYGSTAYLKELRPAVAAG